MSSIAPAAAPQPPPAAGVAKPEPPAAGAAAKEPAASGPEELNAEPPAQIVKPPAGSAPPTTAASEKVTAAPPKPAAPAAAPSPVAVKPAAPEAPKPPAQAAAAATVTATAVKAPPAAPASTPTAVTASTTAPTAPSTNATPLNIPVPNLTLVNKTASSAPPPSKPAESVAVNLAVPPTAASVNSAASAAGAAALVAVPQPKPLVVPKPAPAKAQPAPTVASTKPAAPMAATTIITSVSTTILPSPIRIPTVPMRPAAGLKQLAIPTVPNNSGASSVSIGLKPAMTTASLGGSHRLPASITPVPLIRTPVISKPVSTGSGGSSNNPVSLTVVQQQQHQAENLSFSSKASGAIAATGVSNIRQITGGSSATFPVTIRATNAALSHSGQQQQQTPGGGATNLIKTGGSSIQLFPSSAISAGVQIRAPVPLIRTPATLGGQATVAGGASITLKTPTGGQIPANLRSPDSGVRVSIIPSNASSGAFGAKTGLNSSTATLYKPITITTQPGQQQHQLHHHSQAGGGGAALLSPGMRHHLSPQQQSVRIGIPTVSGATTGGHQIVATTTGGGGQRMTLVTGQTVTLNPVPIGASPQAAPPQTGSQQQQLHFGSAGTGHQTMTAARILTQAGGPGASRLITVPASTLPQSLATSVSIQKTIVSAPMSGGAKTLSFPYSAVSTTVSLPSGATAISIPKATSISAAHGATLTATLTPQQQQQLLQGGPGGAGIPIARVIPQTPLVSISSGGARDPSNSAANLYITNTPLQISTSEGAIVLTTTSGNLNQQQSQHAHTAQRAILGIPGGAKLTAISASGQALTSGGGGGGLRGAVAANVINSATFELSMGPGGDGANDRRPGILRRREGDRVDIQPSDLSVSSPRRSISGTLAAGATLTAINVPRHLHFQQQAAIAAASGPVKQDGSSSGSTTLSATSSPYDVNNEGNLSGDDLQAGSSAATERKRLMEQQARLFLEQQQAQQMGVSPRKKPRKQHLTPQKDPSSALLAATFVDPADGVKRKIAAAEKPDYIRRPQMSLLHSYRHTWKSRHNHFLRYSDVKPRDERKPTVNELASEKYIMQKVNGWKLHHLSAQLEDIDDTESELSQRLTELQKRLEASASRDLSKDLHKVFEVVKANLQRSKIIRENIKDTKTQTMKLFDHKQPVVEILNKYSNKRNIKKKIEMDL